MSILIKKPGILTTVQDLGRFGNRRYGINPTGAMDPKAVRLINALLGNDEHEAVLEMHFPSAELEFKQPTSFAIGGANFNAELDGNKILNWHLHQAEQGSVLRFAEKVKGNRCYFSIAGGFAIDRWLGSASTNLAAKAGGFQGRRLWAGDVIEARSKELVDLKIGISRSLIPIYSAFPTVRILNGAEFDQLTAKSEIDLIHGRFKISRDSNRMGFRLTGEMLHLISQKELVSSAVCYGTIQLLPDGQLVMLMAGHQTSGGYPRIGHVISVDLPLIGQLGPGDGVGFHIVSIDEAESLSEDFERDLKMLKLGRRLAVR
jgi:antagonist of KipI